jgi:hypothetical protein
VTELAPGEKLIWQGRPEGGARPDLSKPGEILFGLVFIAFSLFWMDKAMDDGPIWLAGLPFLAIGLKLAFWRAWGPRLRSKFAHYTLTDRRALVELRWPLVGSARQEMTVTPSTIVDIDGPAPETITLTQSLTGPRGTTRESLRFERLADGQRVLNLIRDIQKGAA